MTRGEAVAIARSWLGTPYHLRARIKGVGCDCATLIAEYLIEAGFAEREELGMYSQDWFCHAGDERYLVALMRHARPALSRAAGPVSVQARCMGTPPETQPGNVALFRVARSKRYNHAAIITRWPMGIHANTETVAEVDLTQNEMTAFQEMAIFDPFRSSDAGR